MRRSPEHRRARSYARTFALLGTALAVWAALVLMLGPTWVAAGLPVAAAALGWLLGRREDALLAQSLTDPLTGLWNRRAFEARLEEEAARARRHGTSLALLFIDVDRLKEINDLHGHRAGDVALRSVGEALRRSCRIDDLPARLGGDEFAILAPHTSGSDALELAQRVQTRLHEQGDGVSVSIGVADLSGTGSSNHLLELADRALYVAKAAGRARIAELHDAA